MAEDQKDAQPAEQPAAPQQPREAKQEPAKQEPAAKTDAPAEQAVPAQAPESGEGGTAGEKAAPAPEQRRGRARGRMVPAGIVHIKATFNNTQVSITDMRGGLIAWCSAGRGGFKGSRKSTAFAATVVAQDAARQAIAKGMHEAEVRVQGAGAGRESAVRAIQSAGINISVIKDVTPIPHNGCRPRKRRRV